MSVINVVAKMSDLPVENAKAESTSSGDAFEQVLQTAVNDSAANAANTTCINCAAATSAPQTTEVEAVTDPEINRSAMYRFTVFVRVSGDMEALSQTLAEEFKSLTKGFVNELLGEKETGVEALDGYLSQAESSVGKGLESSKSLIDSMISAADYGLKATIASMSGSSWMSSLGGSSSSGLTSTSMADIAKIYLQDSVNKGASGSTSTIASNFSAGAVSYGGGYQLQMVNGATAPLKIASEDSETPEVAALSRKDKILDRFLQLIDDISGAIGGRVIKAGYSVSFYDSALSRDMEVKEPASAQVVNAVDESPVESVEPAEEVLI
ncbi:MAG: hypothetical protein KKB51_16435 [Candidatus Riflebacteria bacterium]|nr:hypothetical protein [Candidatus Riflebacteria bacterium]